MLYVTSAVEYLFGRQHISLHLSKADAAERATDLARTYMQSQDTKGWNWDLEPARPDPVDPDRAGRKIATRWVVCVHYTKDGAVLDGAAVLLVNIANGSVSFMESP